ncbi:hypothetical protein [Streptomyces cadmiisoli]|uniref:Uncharacterized protein n=1 Tax=Streptomyces cadmiisoli TaxID=2184053 RepID=A0A2Z4IRH7_9ACTN|nr:hypothetical protein [Streptomyces cadmiisoli]AWW35300.1 hypothetical protein DN051_00030 [Streptomyces cadmiisoli]AWW42140.1 hypothetical protein DN051_40780 [Streptomyces cadmiisoli]
MSVLSALAHVQAMESMQAVPLTKFRHRHLSGRPLVIVPLAMAGEAGAPLAAMVGSAKRNGTLLVVAQPRNRDQRFAFAADLGQIVMDYIDSFRQDRRGQGERSRYTDAPQILVPNPSGVKALADLGRMCRFRATSGPYAVPDVVPEFGMWLTFLIERAEQAGTSLLLSVTEMLTEHWATGQSTLEDQNLASLMAWISPPSGLSVEQAMADAENPDVCPPAGPSTSPEFDNRDLAPAIRRFDTARTLGDPHALAAAEAELRELIAGQIQPTWRTVWQAISLLRSVPEAPRTAKRFEGDCRDFTKYSDYRDSDGLPQRKRDTAIGAARRLSRLERALAEFESDMAFDDRFVLADRRSAGEAFAGTVVETEPGRTATTDNNRRVPRPLVTVRTEDPVRLAADTKLISPSMPAGHKAMIVSVLPDGDATRITVEVNAGMGHGRVPKPGTVPEPGQYVAYLPDPGWRPTPQFPASDATPWTHSASDTSNTEVPENAAAEEWGNED